MSANHNQDFNQAIRIIEAAKDAGVGAVKLQTYTPDTITIDCDNEYFRIGKGTMGNNLLRIMFDPFARCMGWIRGILLR